MFKIKIPTLMAIVFIGIVLLLILSIVIHVTDEFFHDSAYYLIGNTLNICIESSGRNINIKKDIINDPISEPYHLTDIKYYTLWDTLYLQNNALNLRIWGNTRIDTIGKIPDSSISLCLLEMTGDCDFVKPYSLKYQWGRFLINTDISEGCMDTPATIVSVSDTNNSRVIISGLGHVRFYRFGYEKLIIVSSYYCLAKTVIFTLTPKI